MSLRFGRLAAAAGWRPFDLFHAGVTVVVCAQMAVALAKAD
jgi:hypothetical protein